MTDVSVQAMAGAVVSAMDILDVADRAVDVAAYEIFLAGSHSRNYGAGSLFKILIHSNTVPLDYVIEEGIVDGGPYSQIAAGAAAIGAPGEVTFDGTGVLYGLLLRVRIKSSSGAGVFSVQIAIH